MAHPTKDGGPIMETSKVGASAPAQDAEAEQRALDRAAFAGANEGIRQALRDANEGKVRSAREFFAEFESARGLSQ
jgi:hypothetical protein